ncbi:MAG TPA: EI24 domain-containing protein [Burkholderiales bacterium]|nr:EI24 domain-containing protein [Burkholderiales bacterium]
MIGAARNLLSAKVLAIAALPMLSALVLWAGLAGWFWNGWVEAVRSALVGMTDFLDFGWFDVSELAGAAAKGLLVLLLLPAVLATASLIAAVLAMPMLVGLVSRRDFPRLDRRQGGSLLAGLWNACAALGAFLALWLLSLPLWLIAGPFAAIVPWLLSAHLNQRLFRYDALSEHASAEEMRCLFQTRVGGLFVLGLVTGALYFVPFVNLFAPTFSALAFIHYCLAELQRLRVCGQGAVS